MRNTMLQLLAALLLGTSNSTLAGVHYVHLNSTNPTPPYTNWATAATNIQDAVDAATAGDEILVTNGIYATGGRDGNRVKVDKPLNIGSVNGPQFAYIDGGGFDRRCVYLTNAATLSGFTLTNGVNSHDGGGVWCAASDAVVSNCVISGNQALTYSGDYTYGGGAFGGTLNNCTLIGNSVQYVYPGFPVMDLFASGGGAAYCTLNHCTLVGNSVAFSSFDGESAIVGGGGAAYCTLDNCTLVGNSATAFFGSEYSVYTVWGGGAFDCTLNDCTVAGNSAAGDVSGGFGGGVEACALTNCIVHFNTVAGPGAVGPESSSVVGNSIWFRDPLFVDTNGWANLRLQSNSPCINAGNNSYVSNATDLDGNPRIAGGTVDIGAYEFQSPASQISYAWLQQYGLSINSSTDTADPDGDGVDNYHEWLAGTDPTNCLSSPAQLTITASGIPPCGIILSWSTNAVGFTLQSSTNLSSPTAWVTNSLLPVDVNGQNTVTNLISGPQQFYRLIH